MKFGATIKQGLYAEWSNFYIDYSGLKKFVKKRQEKHEQARDAGTSNWDDTDEAEFLRKLEDELSKVSKFQEDKVAELHSQIGLYSAEVERIVEQHKHIHSKTASESERTARMGDDEENLERPTHPEAYSSDEEDDEEDDEARERRFVELEEDLEVLIADVYDLGRFTHLNYTGFIKIVKKHDKRTGWELKGDFVRRYLEKRPFYRENYDALIVQLSKLYNLVRTRGNPVQGDSAAGGAQSAFVRQTTKYWVHPDNYVNLKLAILKHLPVLVFNPDKEFEARDAAISSIYFDNEELYLYLGRLEKTEGAEAIRLRWYGDMGVKQIFVERKTHREDWTGEKSVKARFPIKEEFVNDYLSGKLSVEELFADIRKKGKKSEKEIESMTRLATEVQQRVKEKKLCPVMRTFYNRTAFQLPGDARVRISFDTNLTLVREDNWDGRRRAGDNWRRMDIGIDWPFDQLREEDCELFPYGVLEVKLQTQMGQEPPEWVRELVSSHLVEAVPKFSKFIHGCATLMPHRVDLVPFWLPQMETDIRKPMTSGKTALIERPQTSSHTPTTLSDTTPDAPSYTEPLSEDEDEGDHADEHEGGGDPMKRVAADEFGVSGLPDHARSMVEDAKAFREKNQNASSYLDPSDVTVKGTSKRHDDTHKLTPGNLKKLLAQKYGDDQAQKDQVENDQEAASTNGAGASGILPEGPQFVRDFTYNGKRIAVPVRVEPKVNFALERTLLAWVEFSVLISAIGVGLLNFSKKHDTVGFASAITFTIIGLAAIAWSGFMFLYRAIAIRRRLAIHYDDRFGTSVIVIALVAATAVNFSLRIAEAI